MAGSVLGSSESILETSIKTSALLLALLITVGCESLAILAFAHRRQKSFQSLILSGLLANLVTQPFLWFWLMVFYQRYWVALLSGEVLIVLGEAIFLKLIPANHLSRQEAFLLSLLMNGVSFSAGFFLSV